MFSFANAPKWLKVCAKLAGVKGAKYDIVRNPGMVRDEMKPGIMRVTAKNGSVKEFTFSDGVSAGATETDQDYYESYLK